jgi:hypothetical protein
MLIDPVDVTALPLEFAALLCALTLAPVKLSSWTCGDDPPIHDNA